MSGVPLTTQLVLGKKNFTVNDILSLPRLTDAILAEMGVYCDMVHGNSSDEWHVAPTRHNHNLG